MPIWKRGCNLVHCATTRGKQQQTSEVTWRHMTEIEPKLFANIIAAFLKCQKRQYKFTMKIGMGIKGTYSAVTSVMRSTFQRGPRWRNIYREFMEFPKLALSDSSSRKESMGYSIWARKMSDMKQELKLTVTTNLNLRQRKVAHITGSQNPHVVLFLGQKLICRNENNPLNHPPWQWDNDNESIY